MDKLISSDKINRLKQLLQPARKIVITCHLSPDGDAMGSSLGLCRALRNAGKWTRVLTPDTPPKYLNFLTGADEITVFSRFEAQAVRLLNEADLIFCLDYNEPKRVDHVEKALLESKAPKVMIDHHLFPSDFPDLVISHPEVSSTSMLVYRVLNQLKRADLIDREAAECIFTGMMTDTGNFSYNSNDPALYEAVADLVARGIDKDEIYRRIYFNNSVNRLRLNGYAMDQKLAYYPDHRAAIITLTREELNRYNYQKGDTEDLVNRPLTCPDVTYSLFLREETDYIKVSARSKGPFPVNTLCAEHFNGGGHENAAGGEFYGSLEECVARCEALMPDYDKYLPEHK
ncbi:MAG: bifunctional oligoribonuclease/PAP phosphatase NrnA [[Clostridium] fimetarium]|nr:bifunctional oligoribonuclease/PAP phosphatase NrnA [Alistipes timonensis]MCM1406311.1 bifunctional oligoribonuclease/PAP phosphatase NrnA [[Clostridium] fimetarium]